MQQLNKDCLSEIFQYFDIFDISSCALTCKNWLNIINNSKLWKTPFIKNINEILETCKNCDCNYCHNYSIGKKIRLKCSDSFINEIFSDICPDNWHIFMLLFKINKEVLIKNIINFSRVDIGFICNYQKIDDEIINQLENKRVMDWESYEYNQYVSEDILNKYFNKFDIGFISGLKNLSILFAKKYKKYLDWEIISEYHKLDIKFFKTFTNEINWYEVSCRDDLTKDFILEFYKMLKWNCITADVDNNVQILMNIIDEYKQFYNYESDESEKSEKEY